MTKPFRDCSTCRHEALWLTDEPCSFCVAGPESSRWEPHPNTDVAEINRLWMARVEAAAPREVLNSPAMILPTDPAERKNIPLCTGVLDYFPRALAEVARVSKAGNDQHNPGQPLHWDKTKSMDHADCIPRHLIDRTTRDSDGQRHAAKLAWRALAFLEILLEGEEKTR